MMKNLGDKLVKARTEMGYTVRDAADATRLRADVIENMESGDFDYNLPDIYKRGFLRIYATFLKLDVDSVMEQYSVASKNYFADAKRKTILSRMADVASNAQQSFSNSQSSSFEATQPSIESRFEERSESENADENVSDSSSKFIKLATVFGGVILAVVIIIFVVSSIVDKKAPEENVDIAMNADMPTQPANPTTAVAQPPAPMNEVETELVLVLNALSDTYVLVYPDYKTPDGKPAEVFYTGPMQAGESREFRSKVPIMLKLTDAERVKIERNGKPVDLKGAKGLRLFRIVSK